MNDMIITVDIERNGEIAMTGRTMMENVDKERNGRTVMMESKGMEAKTPKERGC